MHQGDEAQGGPEEDGPAEKDGAHDGLVRQGQSALLRPAGRGGRGLRTV